MKTDTCLLSLLKDMAPPPPYPTSFSPKPSSFGLSLLGLMILLIARTGVAAQAQTGYPEAKDLYVNDFAKILTAEEGATIRSTLARLRNDLGIEALVVTIRSIQNYKTGDRNIESFATNLFNKWGIGDRQRNDGILILVAVKDRKVRIELGFGYRESLNFQMQSVINEQMVPHFKNKNYSLGIIEGTNAVVRMMSERAQAAALPRTPPPVISGNVNSSTSSSGAELVFFVIMGGMIAAILGWIVYTVYHGPRCPHCRVALMGLDEGSENQYLDAGQKLEKSLGAVNYQVWQCRRCDYQTLRSKNSLFSSFSKCQGCGYRTLQVSDSIIAHPTHYAPGVKEITKNCHHCQYFDQQNFVLPMLPPPTHYEHSQSSSFSTSDFGGSSSSSSSFDSGSSSSSSSDGGSSSGDGASGSW